MLTCRCLSLSAHAYLRIQLCVDRMVQKETRGLYLQVLGEEVSSQSEVCRNTNKVLRI